MTNICDIAERYIDSHDVSEGHARELRANARRFGRELTPENLNADLKRLRAAGRADSTIRSRRTYVLLLWRFAASLDLAPDPPMSKIMRVRRVEIIPRGFFPEDIPRLIEAAGTLKGTYKSGIPRAAWWKSYISADWDTGLSVADLLAVERSWIDKHGQIMTVRNKTGRRVAVGLYPATIELIDATFPPDRKLIWPLSVSREWMRQTFCKIVEIAGLDGSLKWLRAGSGTSVDELHGHGEQHLGNTRGVFERHYLCSKPQVRMPQEVLYSNR